MDEFRLIQKIKAMSEEDAKVRVGIGDDAAIISGFPGDIVCCVDTLCEGVHFSRETMRPEDIGHKALAVNLSDIAAMGATPKYFLTALAVGNNWAEETLVKINEGMNGLAKSYDLTLIGGDSVSSQNGLMLSVTVLGEVEKEKGLLRSSAEPGDIVFVSGDLGKSAAGLRLLFERGVNGSFSNEEEKLVKAHQRPKPQVKLGRLFMASGHRIALNDVSDGLANEAWELAEASDAVLCLQERKIPCNDDAVSVFGWEKAMNYAMTGGEDFELVGTIAEENWYDLQKIAENIRVPLTAIGNVEDGPGGVFIENDGKRRELQKGGYRHQ